jgi:hypothetical protein
MILTVRKKPVVVEAVLWTGSNWDELVEWCPYGLSCVRKGIINVDTLEGSMFCNVGDYIIKGVDGEYYPIKKDIFAKTYEIVTEGR